MFHNLRKVKSIMQRFCKTIQIYKIIHYTSTSIICYKVQKCLAAVVPLHTLNGWYRMECENATNSNNKSSSIIAFGMFHNSIIMLVVVVVGVVGFLTLLFASQFFGLYFNFPHNFRFEMEAAIVIIIHAIVAAAKAAAAAVDGAVVVFKIHKSFTFFYFARRPRPNLPHS